MSKNYITVNLQNHAEVYQCKNNIKQPGAIIKTENMPKAVHTKIEIGQLLPPFALNTTECKTVSPWDYKEKKCLFLFFFDVRDSIDWESLAVIKERFDELNNSNAVVLAVAKGSPEEVDECVMSLDLPFDVLIDENDKARRAFGISKCTIIATDRFGEIRLIEEVYNNIERVIDRAITYVSLSELECPECGVGTWDMPIGYSNTNK